LNKLFFLPPVTRRWLPVLAASLLCGQAWAAAPIRFLLTFDDGPSLWRSTPTQRIQAQLADNPTMPGIKAVFFVQTAHRDHGGSAAGQKLMHDSCEAGHLLAVHSGSPRGHIPHVKLAPEELAQSLQDGRLAIQAQCKQAVTLVRPPDWEYNDATLAAYQAAGMGMLLSDLSANDGKIYGWIISLRRRSHLHRELENAAKAYAQGALPEVDGVTPLVMTFHDTNPYTADHMSEYLQILVEEARAVGLPLAEEPFYKRTDELERAAQRRASEVRFVCDDVSRSVTFAERWLQRGADLRRGCI